VHLHLPDEAFTGFAKQHDTYYTDWLPRGELDFTSVLAAVDSSGGYGDGPPEPLRHRSESWRRQVCRRSGHSW
jgi:hypothetical protein